jgi:hypothetical protein
LNIANQIVAFIDRASKRVQIRGEGALVEQGEHLRDR